MFRASGGSPSKRKRGGPTGGRGTGSPASITTPTVDNVLAPLEQLRQIPSAGGLVFTRLLMLAALLQVGLVFI